MAEIFYNYFIFMYHQAFLENRMANILTKAQRELLIQCQNAEEIPANELVGYLMRLYDQVEIQPGSLTPESVAALRLVLKRHNLADSRSAILTNIEAICSFADQSDKWNHKTEPALPETDEKSGLPPEPYVTEIAAPTEPVDKFREVPLPTSRNPLGRNPYFEGEKAIYLQGLDKEGVLTPNKFMEALYKFHHQKMLYLQPIDRQYRFTEDVRKALNAEDPPKEITDKIEAFLAHIAYKHGLVVAERPKPGQEPINRGSQADATLGL